MKRITPWTLIALAGALLVAGPVEAALVCPSLTVNYVWVYPQSGTLVATVNSPDLSQQASWSLCSLNSTVGSITPDMCATIHTTLLVAKTTQKVIDIKFLPGLLNGSGGTALTCEEVPTFNLDAVAPFIWYVRLNP